MFKLVRTKVIMLFGYKGTKKVVKHHPKDRKIMMQFIKNVNGSDFLKSQFSILN